MNSRRILFVNRFYWPDEPATAQLLTDLAEALADLGWSVTVLTSQARPTGHPLEETRHGVHIVRLPAKNKARSGLVAKAQAIVAFSRAAAQKLQTLTQPGDVLVLMTDPPLLSVLATKAAVRRGITVVHWVQDIYPEVALTLKRSAWPLGVLRPWRDAAWRAAAACVVPGSDMADFVRSRGVMSERIVISPNWAPAGLSPENGDAVARLRAEWGLGGKFIVAYSGNLGRVHDLAPLIQLAEKLKAEPNLVFLFVGSGAQKDAIERSVAELRLPNVQFRPAQPREHLATSLSLGDVHVVSLREDCVRWVFPSKLYGITAVGRPVIFIGPIDCELARVVGEHGFGYAFRGSEQEALANTLRQLKSTTSVWRTLGEAALRFHAEQGHSSHAIATWRGLLDTLKPLAGAPGNSQAPLPRP